VRTEVLPEVLIESYEHWGTAIYFNLGEDATVI
jgi:hypothetical protein